MPRPWTAAYARALYFVWGLLLVILCGSIAFIHLKSGLFFSWDASAYVTVAEHSPQDGSPFYFNASYLQSLGNIAWPNNFRLLPEFVFSMRGNEVNGVIFYLVASSLFFASVFFVGVLFEFSPATSAMAGLLFVWLTMPFTVPPFYIGVYWWHAPFWLPLVYGFSSFIISIRLLGRLNKAANIIPALGLFALVVWTLLAFAKLAFMLAICVFIAALVLTAASRDKSELVWKLATYFLVGLVVLFFGPLDYFRGLLGYTTNTLFFGVMDGSATSVAHIILAGISQDFSRPSVALHNINAWVGGIVGYPIIFCALLATTAEFMASSSRHGSIRLLAILTWILFAAALPIVYGEIVGGAIFPLLCLLVVQGGFRAATSVTFLISKWTKRDLLFQVTPSLSGTVLAAAAVVLVLKQTAPTGGAVYPPHRTPVIDYLEARVRFAQGDRFRGRFLALTPSMAIDERFTPPNSNLLVGLMSATSHATAATGNDLAFNGPRFYSIPITIEHNRMGTPLSLMFFESLLMRAGQINRIDYRLTSLARIDILRLIGVRFLLGWESLAGNGVTVVADAPVPGWPEVKLLKISGSNVDGYYPNKIQKIANFAKILDFMESSSFDPSQVVVMGDEAPLYPDLVMPENSKIFRTERGIRVHARSQGVSLLVLPFEFSDCIDVQRLANDSNLIWIGRGDLLLTAIIFNRSLDVELEFRFGPFTNSKCRLLDIAGLRRLGLNSASFVAFKQAHPGKFELDGQY